MYSTQSSILFIQVMPQKVRQSSVGVNKCPKSYRQRIQRRAEEGKVHQPKLQESSSLKNVPASAHLTLMNRTLDRLWYSITVPTCTLHVPVLVGPGLILNPPHLTRVFLQLSASASPPPCALHRQMRHIKRRSPAAHLPKPP